jgi:uncharacterized protein
MLWAAVMGLYLGPLLMVGVSNRRRWLDFFDGYILVSIVGLVFVHLLPHGMEEVGWRALAALGIGLFVPFILEPKLQATHGVTLVAALVGLVLHAALDGVGLSAAHLDHIHGDKLALAVVLHRLPVGLLVYSSVALAKGARWAWGAVSLLAAATLWGYGLGEALWASLSASYLAVFETFVAGALLHVVVHQVTDRECGHTHAVHLEEHHHHDGYVQASVRPEKWTFWGALLGGATLLIIHLVSVSSQTHPHASGSGDLFIRLALESAPALLVAYMLAGLMRALVRPGTLAWLGRGSSLMQSLRGVIFGLPLPICSCGVLPLYQSLVKRGVPATAALSFLIATPELGLDALLISLPLLGGNLTFARLVAAILVAILVSWWMGTLFSNPTPSAEHSEAKEAHFLERLKEGFLYAGGSLVDHTLPWILVGLGTAALVEPILSYDMLQGIPTVAQVPLFALVGIPLYVCASGATPLAAVAMYKGVSAGAALAFLLTGPATNITTFGVLRQLHGRKIALLFGASVSAVAILLGWGVDFMLPQASVVLRHTREHQVTGWQWLCLGGLSILLLSSLYRQGPRVFLNQVLRPIHAHSESDHTS